MKPKENNARFKIIDRHHLWRSVFSEFSQPILAGQKVRNQYFVDDDWPLFQVLLCIITALICQAKSVIASKKINLSLCATKICYSKDLTFDFNRTFLEHTYYILC